MCRTSLRIGRVGPAETCGRQSTLRSWRRQQRFHTRAFRLSSTGRRWGTLVAIEGDKLVVSAPRLKIRNGVLHVGEPQLETVTGWWDESGPMGGAVEGDQLSLHWGWACDRLTAGQQRRLQAWTLAALRIANQAI